MFPLRHAALRLLTTRSSSSIARSRTFTSFTSISSKPIRSTPSIAFQRRWASNEAEAKKESDGEVPVSQLQPTPQEEVENAIQQDNAAPVESTGSSTNEPVIAETANATEATEDMTTSAAEPESVAESLDTTVSSSETSGATGFAETVPPARTPDAPFSRRGPLRDPPTPKPTIYVGNLFFDVTENDLTKEFGRFGTIKRTKLIRDTRGLSKGFGYIQFENTEQAQKAIDELHQQLFEGRRLLVSFAAADEAHATKSPRDPSAGPVNPPSKTLFIGNMSFEMTDKDLNLLFRGIRNVIDVRVAIDRRTGQPRGFAHADFVDTKSAMDAAKILATKENYGRKLRIDYSVASSTAPRNNAPR